MGKRRVITAGQLLNSLKQDPQYTKKLAELDKHKEEYRRKYAEAAAPLLKELTKHGFYLDSVGDLIHKYLSEYKNSAREVVPLLAEWLPRVKEDVLREDITRTLSVPWAKPIARQLINGLKNTSNPNEQWVIGNALAVVGDDEVLDNLLEIVSDKKYGNSRTMVALALSNMKDPKNKEKATDALIKLLAEKDMVFTAIQALRKLKSTKAKPYIEKFLDHPDAEIRNEAKKAIKKING